MRVAVDQAGPPGIAPYVRSHVSLDGLARFLLRAESVGSSMIEGLVAATRRLVQAEVALTRGDDAGDAEAVEVLGNIAAMQRAVEVASGEGPFTLDDLLGIHRTLMDRSPAPQLGGVVRGVPNWIGGSSHNPCSASFVPPPPDHVPDLLDDLVAYVNHDEHSPLAQAAIAHAQFETIHPFAEGNGRATGRALPDGPERSAAAARWLRLFATATLRACIDAEHYAARIDDLSASWRRRMGRVRADSGTDRLLSVLPAAPIITVESASALIDRSKARTTDAVNALADAGILRQRNVGRRRYWVFEATDVLELFNDLERALAEPDRRYP